GHGAGGVGGKEAVFSAIIVQITGLGNKIFPAGAKAFKSVFKNIGELVGAGNQPGDQNHGNDDPFCSQIPVNKVNQKDIKRGSGKFVGKQMPEPIPIVPAQIVEEKEKFLVQLQNFLHQS